MSSVHNKSQPALPNPFLVCSFGDTRQQQHKEQRTDSTIHPLSTALAASARRPPSSDQRNGPSGSIPSAFGSSSTWGDSIWTPGNVGFANTLASNTTSRENSYSRDNSQKPPVKDSVEGKTGSGALVESSVSDDHSWFRRTSSFSSKITDRSPFELTPSDVNFNQQRKPSNAGLPQAYGGASQNSSISTFSARAAPANLNSNGGSKSTFGGFDLAPSSTAPEAPMVFTKFDRSSKSSGVRLADSAWGDGTLASSPSDERKTLANGYFGNQSQTSSRNNSLPPSRHSDVAPHFSGRGDLYPDAHSAANPLRGSSMSAASGVPIAPRANGAPGARFDSPMNQMATQFGQFNMSDYQSVATQQTEAPSFFSHSPAYSTSPVAVRNGSIAASQHHDSNEAEDIPRTTFSADVYPSLAAAESLTFRTPQFDSRPYSNGAVQYSRQATHWPGSAAFQRSFDHVNGTQMANGLNGISHNHAAALEQKLRSLPVQFQEQPYASESRAQVLMRHSPTALYGPYGFPQGVPMYNMQFHPNLPHGLQVGVLPMMDVAGAPRAPRDHVESGHNVRSQLLDDFKNNSKTNKRYELKDIYNHVVEFSGDQHGSRFIQLKLESANSDEKERIFREIQPNAYQLMMDVFGNYVIQKFFEHGDQTQKKVLANKMKGRVKELSLQMYGCRVVQKALDHILNDQQATLIRELEHDVIRCVKDQNGNHVIQKAIERCEAKDIEFIFSSFTNQIHALSIHTYGCRVIQRCLEHCEAPTRQLILRELQDSMPGLIGDAFGNYVVQHVVQHGGPDDRQKVLDLVMKGFEGYSKHKFASNVVEQCLTFASDAWRKGVVDIIIRGNRREGEGMLIGFIRDNYGNYVIQKLLDVLSQEQYLSFMSVLQPEMARAKRTGCGKQVMAIEKKMHRFGSSYGSMATTTTTTAFASRSSMSAATTPPPPPLTSDERSIQTSSAASVNGDAMEGATSQGKGAVPNAEPAIFEANLGR